jgi:hypothetical protein
MNGHAYLECAIQWIVAAIGPRGWSSRVPLKDWNNMGAWGSGPFENDAALDWVRELKRSDDREFPLTVLRQLDAAAGIGGREGEIGVAAAEVVAASRGWPSEALPGGVLDWLERTGGSTEASAAELALRVVAAIEGETSDLRSLWDEGGGVEWRERMADLRERLEAPTREVSLPPQVPEIQVQVGDVAQLLTSAGQVAYVQFIGKAGEFGFDLIRVLPGLFSLPPWGGGLAALIGGETAFLSHGLFRGMLSLDGSQHRGNYPVPPPLRGPQPLKLHLKALGPGGGPVTYQGRKIPAEEFARLHPDIDQTMLADSNRIPFPDTLLGMIECGWRPWMGDDDPEDQPPRPAPYPPTAQPGKFLLDS